MVVKLSRSKDKNDVARSGNNILYNANKLREAYEKTWAVSTTAPPFCKVTHKGDKSTRRTKQMISTSAFEIAASGAALRASRALQNRCSALRVGIKKESSRAPWKPTVSPGARMVLSQFLCALAQEAGFKGHLVRRMLRNERLSPKALKVGWDNTQKSVFRTATLMPSTMVVVPTEKKRSKNTAKEADTNTARDAKAAKAAKAAKDAKDAKEKEAPQKGKASAKPIAQPEEEDCSDYDEEQPAGSVEELALED